MSLFSRSFLLFISIDFWRKILQHQIIVENVTIFLFDCAIYLHTNMENIAAHEAIRPVNNWIECFHSTISPSCWLASEIPWSIIDRLLVSALIFLYIAIHLHIKHLHNSSSSIRILNLKSQYTQIDIKAPVNVRLWLLCNSDNWARKFNWNWP